MTRGKAINQHIPMPMGVTKIQENLIFTVSVPNAKECTLKIYDSKTNQLTGQHTMKQNSRIGSVFSIQIPLRNLKGDCYLYEAMEREFIDPYANRIIGREEFGRREESSSVYGTWCFDEYDWSDEKRTEYSYSDLIIYKLHVRGFTMSPKSGVTHKGTYRGVTEKIPYLKELGINCVFLMPCIDFNEMINQKERYYGVPQYTKSYMNKGTYQPVVAQPADVPKINYWGYTNDGYYFAPKSSYASEPDQCIREFKDMVKALHNASIEVILDMYFPNEFGPLQILECLRSWALNFHIDGFRVNTNATVEQLIATDPYLARTKLLAGNWNTSNIYTKEVVPLYKNLAEYNEGFLYDTRRFLKSDEEQVKSFIERFKKNSDRVGVINYITDHDGFTLNDLYSYDIKHNENNGENNHDGTDYNYSWNCGTEGVTRKKKIKELRLKMQFNALTALFLSQGTPMLLAGDEFGNSQQGNNNAYCQDNEIGWVDWKKKSYNKEQLEFVKQLITLRKKHPVFHNSIELRGIDYISCGKPDISFHGTKA
ncbi:MAG: alpha-amylase family glycosyl hydrolase, partial [Clostridiales bacterium]|nr:alpha-amylase family glycosyl hydrolase [Clostridiales bacterium]